MLKGCNIATNLNYLSELSSLPTKWLQRSTDAAAVMREHLEFQSADELTN